MCNVCLYRRCCALAKGLALSQYNLQGLHLQYTQFKKDRTWQNPVARSLLWISLEFGSMSVCFDLVPMKLAYDATCIPWRALSQAWTLCLACRKITSRWFTAFSPMFSLSTRPGATTWMDLNALMMKWCTSFPEGSAKARSNQKTWRLATPWECQGVQDDTPKLYVGYSWFMIPIYLSICLSIYLSVCLSI